jgi:hypothetical protein
MLVGGAVLRIHGLFFVSKRKEDMKALGYQRREPENTPPGALELIGEFFLIDYPHVVSQNHFNCF